MGVVKATKVHGAGAEKVVEINIQGERTCGSGRFSNVYEATLVYPEHRPVAIKNAWEETSSGSLIYPEVEILSQLQHRNVVNLLYFFDRKVDMKTIHCLVLDFLPDDVTRLRTKGVRFDLLDAKMYSYQLFAAVAYVHSKNIIHLDIKPANLIVDHTKGHLKLCDFGNAKLLAPGVRLNSAYQVTRYYRPPELLFGSLEPRTAMDVWSAACVLYDFATNRTLFQGRSSDDQMRMLVGVFGYPSESDIKDMKCSRPRVARATPKGLEKSITSELPSDALALLKSIFIYSPTSRPTAVKCLEHEYFKQLATKPAPMRSNGAQVDLFTPNNKETNNNNTEQEDSDSSEEDARK